MGRLIFITGGARSGKSHLSERIAAQIGGAVIYLATLEPLDTEMRERVASHKRARPQQWRTIEEPLEPIEALDSCRPFDVCLMDCLTLWISNLLLKEVTPEETLSRVRALLDWQVRLPSALIVVSNEVGDGVVPEYALGRLFRDLLGEANQLIAAVADDAYLCVAGYAIDIKATGRPIRDWQRLRP